MLRMPAALTVGMLLTGCVAAYGPYPAAAPYYQYGPYPAEAVSFDGFYDSYYGPFYGGYWGHDGYFYYADRNRGFHRDFGGHFRHEAVPGYHPFHAAPRGGGHPGEAPHR